MMRREDFLNELIAEGLLSSQQLEQARALVALDDQQPDRPLIRSGLITERKLLAFLAPRLGYHFYDNLAACEVPAEFIARVPIALAREVQQIAIAHDADHFIVACCQPFDLLALDDIASKLGAAVEPVLAPASEIRNLIDSAYARSQELLGRVTLDELVGSGQLLTNAEDLLDIASKAPIVRLVNNLLLRAMKMRASDIHLQPSPEHLLVRFRIDGVLYDIEQLPRQIQDAVVTRVKVIAHMDIAERRLPQDGRASYTVGQGELDLRIASVPTAHGERVVFRLLDKSSRRLTLEQIGIAPTTLAHFRRMIAAPNGILLVTGPTGSGKTTTLYAALAEIDCSAKNILTIEDPIEYHLAGISQVQVATKKGLTFAAGLRSFLRQDPDVMMVGEIRDAETARIAIQAAQTGHLVLSTLHTNNSAGAITRMLDIGAEPYLVASSLIGVVAQRLVRRICELCREPRTEQLPPEILAASGGSVPSLEASSWHGHGCEHCLDTGYWERTGIYELMEVGDAIREAISSRASASTIKQLALACGMTTLRRDGIAKALAGITTIEEVLTVTQPD
jgi:general secretion pathway protein E